MTATKRKRLDDAPLPSVGDVVEKVAASYGEKRARRAGLVTLLAAAEMLYKRHVEDRARARAAMQRALEDESRAREGEDYWAATIASLVDELVATKVSAQLEHRNMFRGVAMVRTTPVDGARALRSHEEGAHNAIGETTLMFPRTHKLATYRAVLAAAGQCWKPRHAPRIPSRDLNVGACAPRLATRYACGGACS